MISTAAIRIVTVTCALGALTALGGCAQTTSAIPTWDHPLDVRNCRKVVEVSPPTRTEGGFGQAVAGMRAATVASGGTDLLLRRDSRDWSVTTGVAYDCRLAPVRRHHHHHHRRIVKD